MVQININIDQLFEQIDYMVECSFINHVFVGWNLVAFIYQAGIRWQWG